MGITRQFTFKNITFQYHLILEERKTIAASVFPSQTVVVKAPLEASDERINAFLRRKFRWVLKQKRYFLQFKVKPQKRYVSGESFLYRGRSYKLLVRKTQQDEYVSLHHGTLTIFTALPKQRSHNYNLLKEWYRDKARKVFSERLQACFTQFNHDKMPKLMVRRMTKRWGSYSAKTNTVILNQDLIKGSTRHIDYVITHELCHIVHNQHNQAFYSLLKSKLPQWEQLKAELELRLLG
jgi:predicted metal-dependent hydrolase